MRVGWAAAHCVPSGTPVLEAPVGTPVLEAPGGTLVLEAPGGTPVLEAPVGASVRRQSVHHVGHGDDFKPAGNCLSRTGPLSRAASHVLPVTCCLSHAGSLTHWLTPCIFHALPLVHWLFHIQALSLAVLLTGCRILPLSLFTALLVVPKAALQKCICTSCVRLVQACEI